MPERGDVELAQLRDSEGRRRERKAEVRVRELRSETLSAGQDDLAVVERHALAALHGMPPGVSWDRGIRVRRDEPEVRRRELALAGVAMRIAPRSELLEVGELADVDLGRQVTADRGLERLVGVQVAAGQRPGARVRVFRPLPEQHLELAVAYLEHDGKGDMGRMAGGFQL